MVNGLFQFLLSSLFCVCEWGCGGAAASLHPFSPHGGRVVLTKTICNRARHSHQTFPQKHFNIVTLPRARGSEERPRGELQRAAGKVSWSRFGGTLLAPLFNLLTCGGAALEEAENAAELRVFMRRRVAPRCMAAAGYWKRHWVDNLSCYQTSWEEAGEWGSAHSSSHLSSDFPLHYFCHYTPVSRTQWWNLYFGWQVSAWLHLMSGKWFIIQTDHIRSVTWTFWFDIDH